MFVLQLAIKNCYKLKKVHMTVAPPMNGNIVTTFSEFKYNSNLQQKSTDVSLV
jgi:hypothetical protein